MPSSIAAGSSDRSSRTASSWRRSLRSPKSRFDDER
jgi:hypothetical protein